jgi:hypothetical protein
MFFPERLLDRNKTIIARAKSLLDTAGKYAINAELPADRGENANVSSRQLGEPTQRKAHSYA